MSKFLKFIVHFVVICTILGVLAMAVPPFFGVTTQIMDKTDIKTNLPMGSVTYAIPVKAEEIKPGDPVLAQDSKGGVFRYHMISMDLEKMTGTAVNPKADPSEVINVAAQDYVPKVVITVGFLGYLLVATESIEGLIVLGLAVLFLIILYIIAELWKKDPEEYQEMEDTEPGYVKTKKELKQEEKNRERLLKEEERQIKKEQKAGKKKKKTIRTGGFVDEIEDDEFEDDDDHPVNVQVATSEAHELLKKEIAAATAEEAESAPKHTPKPKKAAEELAAEPELEIFPEEEEEPAEVKKMAIPVWSAAQLADQAKKAGDAPDIVRDEITKVTLFDYSDIFAEGDEEE